MTKTNDIPNEISQDDLETLIDAFEKMDPEEAKIMFRNLIADLEEEGEPVPFTMRLLASQVQYGLITTPVGLAYGIGGLGQLMFAGFIHDEDIEELGDADTVLEEIISDFEENIPLVTSTRNDEEIGALIKNALDGIYEVSDEVFESMEASELQQAVWRELTKIPYGQTLSYEELALRIGKPKAVRAVATAVGENPISIAIPCHRIILKSGEIGEYHWGSDIKEKLLAYEQANRKA